MRLPEALAGDRGRAAVIYARYSTDRQDAQSIDDQIRRCEKWAGEHRLIVTMKYTDLALSGSHMERAGMQRMLHAARQRGGPPFVAVLVDDLSRLSRDIGHTWSIVFNEFASSGVRVIDCNTGMSSDGAGARLTFGAMALVNDTFLQLVKTETHRGLEGRARAGFSTGGRTYGYTTEPEPNPSDAEHPRRRWVVVESQAQIIRRIFELYAAGWSPKKIAAQLNAEAVASPLAGTRWGRERSGWASSSIRVILMNERYIGLLKWNKRHFIRGSSEKKARKAILSAANEVVTSSCPVIVPPELWAAVQERFTRRSHARPCGSGRTVYLLSGILRCGVCGGSMSVRGSKVKAGRRYVQFCCSANANKGEAICANKMTISVKKADRMILGALRETLLQPALVERFIDKFNARVAQARHAAQAVPTGEVAERDIVSQEARVRHLTDAIVEEGMSAALRARLKEEETRLEALRTRRTVQANTNRQVFKPAPVAEVERYLKDLLGTLENEPERGREVLARHLGRISMTPKLVGDRRFYEAAGNFNLSVALMGGREVCGKSSCGDRI